MRSLKKILLCGSLGIVAFACVALSTGVASATLLDYFTFDDNITDTGSNALTASYLGADHLPATPTYGTGKFGRALYYSGVNVLDLGDSSASYFNMSASFTVSTWIKTNTFAARETLFAEIPANSWSSLAVHFTVDTGGTKLLTAQSGGMYTDGPTLSASLADDQWHMVTLTYDSTVDTQYFYVDGMLVGTRNEAFLASTSTNNIRIGACNNITGGHLQAFTGFMDDVRIYDEVLSQTQVQALLIPEPSALALLACGMAGLLCYAWRKRK